ncbi:von Willebrand factor [Bremerella volcania]|uniref:von Willebrand factor n=1 Tax=Bremerella volcania TaxID=2527984 RepID=A0A518C1U5_9BACT|nr:VWA domain-containing protein [Bremerella volcania]QDU73192.1 von Willebrand factor [Bremerella volcania]
MKRFLLVSMLLLSAGFFGCDAKPASNQPGKLSQETNTKSETLNEELARRKDVAKNLRENYSPPPSPKGSFEDSGPNPHGFMPMSRQPLVLSSMPGDGQRPGEGQGPGIGGEKFDKIDENGFIAVNDQPLSTFSIDVDTASYSKIRFYLTSYRRLPPVDAVRIEEMVNYFVYDYPAPTDGEHPFAASLEVANCPWNPDHRLARVALKGKELDLTERPSSNLVFLLDVSGSMNQPNKLPLLKQGMKMLVDQLSENDMISIVVYAGAAGLVLEPTSGDQKAEIISALDQLHAGGSTNGGEGIQLAYKMATDHFLKGATNRVLLCTDGDFNVGTTSTGDLVRLAQEHAKKNIYLSILGFGSDNHNDSLLEQLSNKANGNYTFIDTQQEAKKVLVEQMAGTLVTIAKDVKIQVEFNPTKVAAYRLVGYENRLLKAEDFNDDKKDAGEIGAGHTVTAFYELIPFGTETTANGKIDDLKYQTERVPSEAAQSDELLTLKLRYKQPDSDTSTLMTSTIVDDGKDFAKASGDFQFAAAVAMFGMLLRDSEQTQKTSYAAIEEIAAPYAGGPGASYRAEFLEMVHQAEGLPK